MESKNYIEKLEKYCEGDGWSLMVMPCGRESRNSWPPSSAGSSSGLLVDRDPNVALICLKWPICQFCHGWKELS